MKNLSLLLCALVGAAVLSVGNLALHAQPVRADTAFFCGQGAEVYDSVYQDSNLRQVNSTLVQDSWPGGPSYHYVDTDLATWHINYSNLCWRAYYTSDFTEDATNGSMRPWIRAWVCGAGPWEFSTYGQQEIWGPNERAVTQGSWGPSAWINRNVQMWDGSIVTLSFAPYGNAQNGTLCGPQADNYKSYAKTNTWYSVHSNSNTIYALPNDPYWYVHF